MATLFGTSGVDIFVNQFTTFQFKTDNLNNPIGPPISPDIVLEGGGNPPVPIPVIFVTTFADIPAVDYSFSPVGVSIDLAANIPGQSLGLVAARQHLGFAEGDVLVDVSSVTGSGFNDVIRGSDSYGDLVFAFDFQRFVGFEGILSIVNDPGENVLVGGDGDDVLEGRGGADILIGGSITGDFGFDFASYESSPAAVTVRLPGVFADTTPGIASGGDAQGDILIGIEGLIGSAFADHLTGNSLNNILIGGLGNDVLDGRDGIDTADYSQDPFNPTVNRVDVHLGLTNAAGTATEFKALIGHFQRLSVDTLISIENVTGTNGPDTIVGNEQANTLDGGFGDDVLDGGLGNDTLIGGFGSGSDTASYASHDSLTGEFGTISLGPSDSVAGHANYFIFVNSNGFFFTLNVETDTLFGIENITGSNLNETLNGNAGDNILDGGFGNDTLIGNGGHDTASFVSHDTGSVPLGESDTISLGLNGADGSFTRSQLNQVLESDVLRGITNVTGSSRSETVNGNEQDNTLDGRGGNDVLNGGEGKDNLTGGAGRDSLNGGPNNDTLIGGADNDVCNGGAGDDTYDFRGPGLGTDFFFDDSGTDTILINSFHDIVDAQQVGHDLVATWTNGIFTIVNHFGGNAIENVQDATGTKVMSTNLIGGNLPGIIAGTDHGETMDGRGGDDILFGNGGNDTLLGGADNDILDGGKGNDILDGGTGDDILTGGDGRDTFVFAPMTHNTPGSGNDVVTDFVHGQDHLDLRAFDTSFRDLKTEDGHGEHGQGHHPGDDDRITMHVDGHDTVLEFAGGSVRITGVTQLHADDFYFEKSSSSFTGTVAGLSGQDAIDFGDTGFGANSTLGSSGNPENSGGTLPVGDGVHMANIALLGSYMASSFAAASGGQGGTLISEAAQASTHTPIVTQPHA